MADENVMRHIEKLTAEEERLYDKGNLDPEELKRLHEVKTELDQYWDLLRQRRALRNAGQDPSDAQMRDSDTVENYEQ